jgi:RimJ/RimL family protein N-acetyltransferase
VTDVAIRRARGDDATALLPFWRRVGSETGYLTFGAEGPGTTEAQQRELLEHAVASDNGLALVAEDGGELVAVLTFSGGARPWTRHVGEFGITVVQSHWGRGIGRRLVAMLLEWAAGGGVVRKINLRVHPANTRAIALYESLGFAIEGRLTRETLVDNEFFDCIVMGLPIDPATPS